MLLLGTPLLRGGLLLVLAMCDAAPVAADDDDDAALLLLMTTMMMMMMMMVMMPATLEIMIIAYAASVLPPASSSNIYCGLSWGPARANKCWSVALHTPVSLMTPMASLHPHHICAMQQSTDGGIVVCVCMILYLICRSAICSPNGL